MFDHPGMYVLAAFGVMVAANILRNIWNNIFAALL